jgi:hypothetical protein
MLSGRECFSPIEKTHRTSPWAGRSAYTVRPFSSVSSGQLPMVRWRSMIGRDPAESLSLQPSAKTWLIALACRKAKERGYPHKLWTTRLLARHACEQ